MTLLLLWLALAGCIDPVPRDQGADARARDRVETLSPQRPELLSPAKDQPPPAASALARAAEQLAAPVALDRAVAWDRLSASGRAGTMACEARLGRAVSAGEAGLVPALLGYLAEASHTDLSPEDLLRVRTSAARALKMEAAACRVAAAEYFERRGAEERRTEFLEALADPERRVRWKVVQRFGRNPEELSATQRRYVALLMADPELAGSVRADAFALLLRLHEALSPQGKPHGYNPYAPPDEQGEATRFWIDWAENPRQ